jgi:quinohemoprotein ethanol dehydrogenase
MADRSFASARQYMLKGSVAWRRAALASAAALLGCAATASSNGAHAEGERLRDGGRGLDWAGPGGTYGEQHFSALEQIDEANVQQLGLAWSIDLPPGQTVTAPIEVGGTLYFASGQGVVRAADVRSGKLLWEYDPKTWQVAGHRLRLGWGSRGLAWWNGKLFVGTMDGRLIAIDARTGKPVWSRMTLTEADAGMGYITGAPRAFGGKVIIGFGGADFGATRGYVSTYDAETGKLLWRWYTVPGDPAKGFENGAMAMAAKTWTGEWWKLGGGGTAWNAFSYDPDTDTVMVGVGNGSPWNAKVRSPGGGDNLFLASIVALDATTGAYKWHYQVNPGESWDFGATMDMQFADLSIDGRLRKVLMTMPKNGFFYVIDRTNGDLISAEPMARVNWASRIDIRTGRPVENLAARYPEGTDFTMWPSGNGAHNWYPMAYSPKTKLVYVPVLERAMSWADFGVKDGGWKAVMPPGTVQAATMNSLPDLTDDPLNKTSRLQAWNPVTQKPVWSQTTPGPEGGSLLATAGNLVFQGQLDGAFNAYAADSGKRVWSFQANAPVLAPPISYSVAGRQYVTVLTGIAGHTALTGADLRRFGIDYRTMPRRVLTFALGGKAVLPPREAPSLAVPDDPDFTANEPSGNRSIMAYGQYCMACHGFDAVAGGSAPDLRISSVTYSAEAFRQVVKEGALAQNGMPKFGEFDDAMLEGLRQYVRSRAHLARRAEPR